MHPLDAVEKRLRCTFPASFRETYAQENVFTECESWEIHTPEEMFRTAPTAGREDEDLVEGGFPDAEGIAVGNDIGGSLLLLRFSQDGKALLEPLFAYDRETREVKEVAKDLAELIIGEEAAHEIVSAPFVAAITKAAERRDEIWDSAKTPKDLDAQGVCKFCGSGLAGEPVCSVCNRHVDEPSDDAVDSGAARSGGVSRVYAHATKIVRQLVDDERLELTSKSAATIGEVIEITARAIDAAGEGVEASVIADALFERWENAPDVEEVFVDELDLTALVYATLNET